MEHDDMDERVVFVRDLDERVTKELLEELFTQMGTVERVTLKDPGGGNQSASRYAFVEFRDQESVLFAVEMLDQVELFGRKLRIAPRDNTEQFKRYMVLRNQFVAKNERTPSAMQPMAECSQSVRTPSRHSLQHLWEGERTYHPQLVSRVCLSQPPPPPPLYNQLAMDTSTMQPAHSNRYSPHSVGSLQAARSYGTPLTHSHSGSYRNAPYNRDGSGHRGGQGGFRQRGGGPQRDERRDFTSWR